MVTFVHMQELGAHKQLLRRLRLGTAITSEEVAALSDPLVHEQTYPGWLEQIARLPQLHAWAGSQEHKPVLLCSTLPPSTLLVV